MHIEKDNKINKLTFIFVRSLSKYSFQMKQSTQSEKERNNSNEHICSERLSLIFVYFANSTTCKHSSNRKMMF